MSVENGVQTHLDFPGQIKFLSRTVANESIKVQQITPTRLQVAPHPEAPAGEWTSVFVDFTVGRASFKFTVDKKGNINPLIQIYLAEEAAFKAMAATIAQPEIEKANDRTKEATEQAERQILRTQSKVVLDQLGGRPPCDKQLLPAYETGRSDKRMRVHWKLLESCWNEENVYLLVPFEVINTGTQPFHLDRDVHVSDQRGDVYPAQITYMSKPGSPDGNVVASIGVEEKVRGVIAIAFGSARSINDLDIRITDNQKARWLTASVSTWKVERVILSYRKPEWIKEIEAREARESLGTQLIIGPRLFGGAFWISNGQVGDGRELDATTFYGLGVRVTKGFSELIALEGEIAGGSTGDASFGSELTRRAKFGRLLIGGVLRLGHKTIPTVRAGLGLQGTDYDSLSAAMKPDDSIEFSPLWYAGVGVSYRTSEQIIIGADASFAQSSSAEPQAPLIIQMGFHIGYGWNP
ncbi:MAG: porin family protein [Proteobacteria bacterium]|nr:porin family protein [Pseudomonadota bacterium]